MSWSQSSDDLDVEDPTLNDFIDENLPPPYQARGKGLIWLPISLEEKSVGDWLEEQGSLSISSTKYTIEGKKVYYRCKSKGCPYQVCVLHPADGTCEKLSEVDVDHLHQENNQQTRGIPQHTKNIITNLVEDGVSKPKQILAALQQRNVESVSTSQLKNFLSSYKRRKNGPTTLSLAGVEEWCQTNQEIPTDMDQPFCVLYETNYQGENDSFFRLFVSTVRLLMLVCESRNVHIDATYKLNWNGFPVFVIGISDKNRIFHPIGVGVCCNEQSEDFAFIFTSVSQGQEKVQAGGFFPEYLIADAAIAITNGFKEAMGYDPKRITCWAHVIMNIDKQLIKVKNPDIQQALRKDICDLQLCHSKEVFDEAIQAFFQKWQDSECQGVATFLEYFDQSWIKHNSFWYEGFAIGVPSTNNGLEATNNIFKKQYTFRSRLPLGDFLSMLKDKMVKEWSQERNPNYVNAKKFSNEVNIDLMLWTESYQWVSSGPVLLKSRECGVTFIRPSQTNNCNTTFSECFKETVKQYRQKQWKTFDEFKIWRYSVWVIDGIQDGEYKSATCTCPTFLKQFICKHIIGIAILRGYVTPPLQAKDVPLGQKRKRGRPSKAKKALIIQ
eukprot:TRINITY_DN12837_c0_g1_i2.p1 TRINITY_DN12837_c0_g1~~TRINITY_DN12837_c0_g1_i2.p1  ORF type:complete len:610 (+),score=28.52 TRINITY_DN12837_c0_g1_i2:103-1932(+)